MLHRREMSRSKSVHQAKAMVVTFAWWLEHLRPTELVVVSLYQVEQAEKKGAQYRSFQDRQPDCRRVVAPSRLAVHLQALPGVSADVCLLLLVMGMQRLATLS